MGAILSAVWRKFTNGGTECKIVIVGLSNAGKTSVLYRMNLGTVILSTPTIGANVEEISFKNVRFQVRKNPFTSH